MESRKSNVRESSIMPSGIRRATLMGLFVALSLSAPAPLRAQATDARPLQIDFIDVMGGAATLIVTPERESILIDSGWPGFDDRDPKRIVHVLKDVEGLDHLDHLVTTHWHMDHYGGVAGLSKRIRIDHFWDRGLPEGSDPAVDRAAFPDGPRTDDPLGIAYRKASEGKRTTLKAGDRLPLRGLSAVVLASSGEVIAEEAIAKLGAGEQVRAKANPRCESAPADQPADASDNARSLAILFSLGQFQFFDAGDLTWNVERSLVCPIDRVGPVDLYQVTHHGLDISNHPTLLETLAPTVAIMNNGPRKGGSPETVKRLRSIASIQAAYQLHKNAATGPEDNTDPALIANPDPAGGQFIRVTVSPDGSTFQVRFGEDGPPREFKAR
jgi:beta-lactamase superfamily II metal-dependent hydrolase